MAVVLELMFTIVSIRLCTIGFVVHGLPRTTARCIRAAMVMIRDSPFEIIGAPDVEFTMLILKHVDVVHVYSIDLKQNKVECWTREIYSRL